LIVMSCEIQLYLAESRSLKDKRQVVKSLKDRIRNRFEVAVAEVEHNDLWQRSTIGMAVVSTETRHAQEVLSHAVDFIERDVRVQVLDYFVEQR